MSTHYGDFAVGRTVYMVFDSFAASTGASSATSNFAASDILVYRDGSTTQRTSSAGITVSTSFDSQTGLQMVVIDLSDDTDTGFYSAGHDYQVAVADVTIDGQTVRFWLGTFSIERLAAGVNVTKIAGATVSTSTAQLGVNVSQAAGVPWTSGAITAASIATDAIGSAELAASAANKIRDAILSDATTFAGASIAAIKAKTDNLPESIKKNTVLNNFEFLMVDATDHVTGKTSLTVAGTVSLDGGAFGALTNSITEVGAGIYKVNLAAADTNGDFLTLKFTATGADTRFIHVKTTS